MVFYKNKRIISSVLLVIYLAILSFGALSSQVGELVPNGIDKLLHTFEFFLLALMLFFVFSSFKMKRKLIFPCVFIISVSIGALTEFAQMLFTFTRAPSWFDFLADLIGIILALLLMVVSEWISSKR